MTRWGRRAEEGEQEGEFPAPGGGGGGEGVRRVNVLSDVHVHALARCNCLLCTGYAGVCPWEMQSCSSWAIKVGCCSDGC